MFYLLSLISGILECGWIAFGAVHSLPLWKILCYPLAYHLGNLFPQPFSLSKPILTGTGVLSVLTSAFTFSKTLSVDTVFVLTGISLFLISVLLQSVRSSLKSDGNRLLKRVFRVGGFAIAPLAAFIPSLILLVSSFIALYALKVYHGRYGISRMKGQNGYSAVMVFHQLHYFFYAHITLASVCLMFTRDSGAKGALFGILLFCGTWITYLSVEPIVSKLTAKILPVFYVGHIGIGLLLLTMSLVTCRYLFIALWLVTGFGGGVVYTISERAKAACSYDKVSMTISENIGHTLGLAAAAGIAGLFEAQSPRIMLVFSSVSAMLAVMSMTFVLRKEKKHEIVRN